MPQTFLYDIHPYMNYTFIQKFGVWDFFMSLKSLRLHLFDHKYSTNSNIVKYYLINLMHLCLMHLNA